MSGNVWEWCRDWFHVNYTGAPVDGSAWESPPSPVRAIRGGGWPTNALACRSALRAFNTPFNRFNFVGFRLARTRVGALNAAPVWELYR